MTGTSKIIAGNIRWLCKKNERKLGDFEESIGVSRGYFSRIVKEDSTASVSVDALIKTAKEFNISLDELCTDLRFEELKSQVADYGYALVPLNKEDYE